MRQEARGKRQEVRGKRQEARGKRQEAIQVMQNHVADKYKIKHDTYTTSYKPNTIPAKLHDVWFRVVCFVFDSCIGPQPGPRPPKK